MGWRQLATSTASCLTGSCFVERSRDPEHDAARALLAKGITGTLTMCDGKTGIPRTIIKIKKAAKISVA
jgi:hypothetical protein